ncbi:MAG TPA: hypothetical protein VF008_01895 [Niastella sp.]
MAEDTFYQSKELRRPHQLNLIEKSNIQEALFFGSSGLSATLLFGTGGLKVVTCIPFSSSIF